jgi:hypothetical protein
MSISKKCAGILAGLASLGVTSVAFAQVQADAQANTNVGMTLPGAAPAAAATGASDHDQVVGRLAVGYLGRRTIGVGAGASAADFTPVLQVEAPVVGVRYWIDSMLGIDAGLGLAITGGGWEADLPAGDGDGDLDSATAFLIHVGVPLSLASYDHFSFQVVPEANVGIGSGSADDGDTSYNGFQLDVGARAGAEIQFGFMGIPQLSLQGSVGLLFGLQSTKTDDDVADSTLTQNRTFLTTTVGDNPWNIFTSNVAALYYF